MSSAFERLVLQHPDIEALLQEVRAKPALFDRCEREFSPPSWPSWRLQKLLEGSYALQAGLWSAIADKSLRDQAEGKSAIGGLNRIPPDAARVLLVVADRFGEFITPMRNGSVAAKGHLANGDLVPLSAGIWRGHDFWIDIFAGCVGEFEETGDDDLGIGFVPRWSGVALEGLRAQFASSSQPREKVALHRVALAVEALWPNRGDRVGVAGKARNSQINDWLKKQKLDPVSPASIKRYFQSGPGSER